MLEKPVEKKLIVLLAIGLLAAVLRAQPSLPSIEISPRMVTDSIKIKGDDLALWIHPTEPTQSVIIGTAKDSANNGLYVWTLSGKLIQYVKLARPLSVDVRYGMKLNDRLIDITVINSRISTKVKVGIRIVKEIKVFAINPTDGTLTDITTNGGIKTSELDEPHGLCLYRRPSDSAMFVIAGSYDDDDRAGSLHQYRLLDDGFGKIKGVHVRAFGQNSMRNMEDGLVADDELGFVYATDAGIAIHKYYADPDQGDNNEIVAFALDNDIQDDRENLAIYRCDDKTGYLLASIQNEDGEGTSLINVYRREGDGGNPNQHSIVASIKTLGASDTASLETTSRPISAAFPHGFLVKQSGARLWFKFYAWEEIARNDLQTCSLLK